MKPNGQVVIGIDGGGTRTRLVVVARPSGGVLESVNGPGVNPVQHGLDVTRARLTRMLKSQMTRWDVAAVGIGLAGVSASESLEAELTAVLGVPVRAVSDGLAALAAAFGLEPGTSVIAGTGSLVVSGRATGEIRRAGGYGYLVGDPGSALAIARRYWQTASGPARVPATVGEAARFAEIVDQLATDGDPLAHIAIRVEAGQLAQMAAKLIDATGNRCVSEHGAVIQRSPLFQAWFRTCLRAAVPDVEFLEAVNPPEVGAAWLASLQVGEPFALTKGSLVSDLQFHPTVLPEGIHSGTRGIDQLSTAQMARLMAHEDSWAVQAASLVSHRVAMVIDEVSARLARGGRLIYVGAGTSGRTAVMDAAECAPTFSAGPERISTLLAGGMEAILSAKEGAEDDEEAGRLAVSEAGIQSIDAVIGVTASGTTAFVRGALIEAQSRGAFVGSVTNNPETAGELPGLNVLCVTGAEVVAGSTRLKAGTSLKVILNAISTSVFVRRGRTLSNLMVGMRVSNRKLRRRAETILCEVAGLDLQTSRELLEQAEGALDVATVMAVKGLDQEQARAVLESVAGNVPAALDSFVD